MTRLRNLSHRLTVSAVALMAVPACGMLPHPSLDRYATLYLNPSLDPAEVHVRFFGVTTLEIDDGSTAIMIDGFFSRPGLMRTSFGQVAPNCDQITAGLKRRGDSTLAAVLVAHSHYDHALDAPAVVDRTTGTRLVGSHSTRNIGLGFGLAEERIDTVKAGDVRTFGSFTIQVFASPHSPGGLYHGTIDDPLHPPARVGAYKMGETFSFLLRHEKGTILIWPSANFAPGLLNGVTADVVFLGVGLLGKQSDEFVRSYWRAVVTATGAKLVIPIHWDNMWRPLDKDLQPMPYLADDFGNTMNLLLELAHTDKVAVRLMPLFAPVDVFAPILLDVKAD